MLCYGRRERRFQDADLEQAAGLAFLPALAVLLAVLGHLAHVLAAVLVHARHLAHAHALHRAGFGRRLDARHPGQRKRQTEEQDYEQPKATDHGGQSMRTLLMQQLNPKRRVSICSRNIRSPLLVDCCHW